MAKKTKLKQKFADRLKDEFDFDVSALPAYVDQEGTDIIEALIEEGHLASRINIMEGVKGKETIKLLDFNISLQSAADCGKTPDGAVIFTGKDMEVVPVKVDLSFCNKDLNGTWGQLLLKLGKRAEKENLPLEAILSSHVVRTGQKKNQDLMFNGDTASLNPDLVHYDGFVKKWKADGTVFTATSAGAWTVSNAFQRMVDLANKIPTELRDAGIEPEIVCSRTIAQLVINNIYNDKDYSANLKVNRDGGEISFELPTVAITVRSYPQLSSGSGLGVGAVQPDVFCVPYDLMFFGTDKQGDMEDFWLFYHEKDEKIYLGAEWASGIQYVRSLYFGRYLAT